MDFNGCVGTGNSGGQRFSGAFLLFMAVFAVLAWEVARPLMTALLWAAMLSFVVTPTYDKIHAAFGGRFPSLASGLTLVLLGFVFLLPLAIIFTTLGSELVGIVRQIYFFVERLELNQAGDAKQLIPTWTPLWIEHRVLNFLHDSSAVNSVVQKAAQWIGTFLTNISGSLLHGASSLLFNMVVTLMVSFFFIRDGRAIVDYVKSVTPLSEDETDAFFTRTGEVLNSVILGSLLTVACQALLGGIGWWFVGLDSPAFFGMLMFFAGLFPAGTILVWGPGSLYLLCTGDAKNAIILFLWGAGVVSVIDNILKPFLISGGKPGREIPTLTIVIGLFGGVVAWGFIGIFLGPLVLVLFTAVLDIYRARKQRFQNKNNPAA